MFSNTPFNNYLGDWAGTCGNCSLKVSFCDVHTHFLEFSLRLSFLASFLFLHLPVNGVADMDEMFDGAAEFEGRGLANWETTSLQWMSWAVR